MNPSNDPGAGPEVEKIPSAPNKRHRISPPCRLPNSDSLNGKNASAKTTPRTGWNRGAPATKGSSTERIQHAMYGLESASA